MKRREMIGTTAAALLAAPLLRALPTIAPAAPGSAPRFFTPAEFALVDELTEMIIPTDEQSPGARAAGVAAYIDGRLAESLDPAWQGQWRSGLEGVDALSHDLVGATFLAATPRQRVAVLTRMAANETSPQTAPEKFFGELKQWTVRSYYTSTIGIHQDQEYKGNVYQTGAYAGYDPT
jgi:Gluconate 2-dehydrogenase subunit 3